MALTPQELYIDFDYQEIKALTTVQYESGARRFHIRFSDHGIPISLDANRHDLKVAMQKPDGKAVLKNCEINDDGTGLLVFDENMCIASGIAKAQFILRDHLDETWIRTMAFQIKIAPAVFDNDTILSTPEFEVLKNLILDVEAELQKTTAFREMMEKTFSEWTEAELLRAGNEQQRIENETGRTAAEATRAAAEKERRENETIRQTQEADREEQTAAAIEDANAAAGNANNAADNLQHKLDTHHFVLTADKDVAGGVPSLDANAKIPLSELYDADTGRKGITQLTDSVNSNSTTTAATPNSVRTVFEKAAGIESALLMERDRAIAAENALNVQLESNKPVWDDKYTKTEVDNKFSMLECSIDWKESVGTFNDIAAAYPAPQDGWTVNVKDTNYTYRYDGSQWVAISANTIPKATQAVDGLLAREDKVRYDDAAATADAAVKSINSLAVGGRNYALDTGTRKSFNFSDGSNGANMTFLSYRININPDWKVGDTITVHFDADLENLTVSHPDGLIGIQGTGNVTQWNPGLFGLTTFLSGAQNNLTKTVHVCFQRTITADNLKNDYWNVHFRCDYCSAGKITWRNLKAEHGNKETDWTPAPEDKVDQIPGKGLSANDYTTDEKAKLAGIEAGANHYTHPAAHPANMITEDPRHRFITDTCFSTSDWNTAVTTGWYMASNALNAPDGDWYFGEVIAHNQNYLVQTIYKFTASADAKLIPKYIRARMNGVWGAWTNVTVAKAVPANAVFTDTNTWRPVQDNLNSTSATDCLSANQGKILKDLINSQSGGGNYLPLSGGTLTGALEVARYDTDVITDPVSSSEMAANRYLGVSKHGDAGKLACYGLTLISTEDTYDKNGDPIIHEGFYIGNMDALSGKQKGYPTIFTQDCICLNDLKVEGCLSGDVHLENDLIVSETAQIMSPAFISGGIRFEPHTYRQEEMESDGNLYVKEEDHIDVHIGQIDKNDRNELGNTNVFIDGDLFINNTSIHTLFEAKNASAYSDAFEISRNSFGGIPNPPTKNYYYIKFSDGLMILAMNIMLYSLDSTRHIYFPVSFINNRYTVNITTNCGASKPDLLCLQKPNFITLNSTVFSDYNESTNFHSVICIGRWK